MKDEIFVLYEDIDYIVVNKQLNILTLPDRYNIFLPNLQDMLETKYGKIYIVHRLDKETSGIICFAKNELAHKELVQQFFEHKVKKVYLAITQGKVVLDEGKIDLPIAQDTNNPQKMKIDFVNGKPSVTEYKVVERFKNYTLVEAYPLTGRRHQIRIHFATIGYPLLADSLYSNNKEIFLSQIKKNYKLKNSDQEKPLISRTALHSYKIKFYHYRKKDFVELQCEPPKDFSILLKNLRKYNV
jgi:23S rRNA pseudouridine1911/1915/1917 synthase